jgi:hypothetical protein
MQICSKCGEDKRDDQYYTYYHSRNKKSYTRKVCNQCMLKQGREVKARIKLRKLNMTQVPTEQIIVEPVVPKLIVEDYSTNPQYRNCTMCLNYKLLIEFYQNKNTGYYHSRCKDCHRNYSNGKLVDYYQEKYKTTGGSERVLPRPGNFMDIYQEEQVSWLLQLIGWDKHGDVWVKKGIKKVVDGKIVWDKIPTKEKVKRVRPNKPKRTYDVDKIVQLRNEGMLLREIATLMGCSRPTIKKILTQVDNGQD